MNEVASYRVGPITMIPIKGIWHCRWEIEKDRRMRTTREPLRNPRKAEEVAQQKYQAALLRSRGEEPECTLAEAVVKWVAAHRYKSESHRENIERFGRLHLGELGPLMLSQVTTARVEDWINVLLDHLGPSTVNQCLTYLRIICKWAVRRRMIRAVPFDVPEIKSKRKPKPLLPTARVQEWLAKVDGLTTTHRAPRMVLRLQVGMGLRPSEARRARWEWLDWERGTYSPGNTKGGDVVARPVPDWLLDYLRPHAKPSGWMVPTKHGVPVGATMLGRIVEGACKALGIPRLTPHRLRATYATWLSEEGVPIQDIREVLEHKDINTTAGYLGIDLGRVRDAQQRTAEKTGLSGRKNGKGTHSNTHGVSL